MQGSGKTRVQRTLMIKQSKNNLRHTKGRADCLTTGHCRVNGVIVRADGHRWPGPAELRRFPDIKLWTQTGSSTKSRLPGTPSSTHKQPAGPVSSRGGVLPHGWDHSQNASPWMRRSKSEPSASSSRFKFLSAFISFSVTKSLFGLVGSLQGSTSSSGGDVDGLEVSFSLRISPTCFGPPGIDKPGGGPRMIPVVFVVSGLRVSGVSSLESMGGMLRVGTSPSSKLCLSPRAGV